MARDDRWFIYIYIDIYIKIALAKLFKLVGWLFGFYGISTFVGYLTQNSAYIYIYIYIYIYSTNLISTSIHGTRKNLKKNPRGTRDKSISNHCLGEKEKIIGQKERKGQPRPTPWKKSRDTQSVGQKKTKNLPRILQCYNYKCAQLEWSQL